MILFTQLLNYILEKYYKQNLLYKGKLKMENFNYYMTFSPKEFEYGTRELILEKRIPLDLYRKL